MRRTALLSGDAGVPLRKISTRILNAAYAVCDVSTIACRPACRSGTKMLLLPLSHV